ncbi:hypothetical protein CMI42_02580 [Candidatus Pacearchaeota archaeon]|nr:hypothetical protein [Candidatus Pacearchaeota archaeon]|tara:strand:- start:722 stop:1132 length:411 start_codon:yes stop_codon:yes gene_type:complete
MPNPRYLSDEGIPTVELLDKMRIAKNVYFENLKSFCGNRGINEDEMKAIKSVWLIGSHASEDNWMDDTSDLDLKLVNPEAFRHNMLEYKLKVLNPILCPEDEEKRRWIDLYFVGETYQVTDPCYDITGDWDQLDIQ